MDRQIYIDKDRIPRQIKIEYLDKYIDRWIDRYIQIKIEYLDR